MKYASEYEGDQPMPTLYVRNFPDDLYHRLRERAARNHRSISAEVIAILEHMLKKEADGKEQAQA